MYYGFGHYFDPTTIILLPAIILAVYAQVKIMAVTNKYFNEKAKAGYSGYDVARIILDRNGLSNVSVEQTGGRLSDHFDPNRNLIRLSDDVYNGTSITALAVAAHECGHAIQYKEGYAPIKARKAIFPVVSFASNLSMLFFMLGLIFSNILTNIGIIMFSATVIFQVITLPVEFDASRRALNNLESLGVIRNDELKGSKKVLNAAAMTYVASTITALLQLLRLIIIANNKRDER